jgi:DDE family transposase
VATVSEVAVSPFSPLLGLLAEVPDPRRGQGQKYKLPHVLLFSILAVVTGAIRIEASSPSSMSIAAG